MAHMGVLSGAGLSLPVEVLEVVLSQLPYNFLITTCTSVCRLWYEVIRNPAFLPWKKLYHHYKLAPSSPISSLLLCKGGDDGDDDDGDGDDDDGDGDDDDGDGGGGGGGVLKAKQVVKRLCNRYDITSTSNCLVSIIRMVGRRHSAPHGTSPTLLQGHRLYPLAQDTLAQLSPSLLPQPHTLWHLAATIALLSHDVWDVHALIRLLLRPGSLFSPCVVVEAFYSIAVFLFHTTTSSHICLPMRYHYQVFYALYLYENDWGGLLEEGQVVRQEQHAGQQSMERYVQRKMAIQYTHEQLRIINHPLQSDHIVKIVAFAGTGKTTTLLELCKKRPDLNFLLVVFNKSVQEYCSLSFPKNTTVKTAHSMAYGFVGRKLRRVALVKKALQRFFNSSDERLTLQHTPTVDKHGEQIEDDFRLQVILADAEAVWAEMTKCSRHQQISMTQDGQLKVWQLSRPRLLQYDVVMIDEGQDMSPSMLDIFLCQACAKVIVGDPHQQIYSFRGAVNALESVESTHTFYLTQSFRFGPEVSYVAQCVLDLNNATQRQTLVGGNKRDTLVASMNTSEALRPSSSRRTAFLGRSNLEVYQQALKMCQQDAFASMTMAFVGGLQKYGLDTVMDIYKLSQVEVSRGTAGSLHIKNKLVAKFQSVRTLKNYADTLDDHELYNKILMYEYSRSSTPHHIQLLEKRCSSLHNVADITFSTIHKAKGLEWDHVVLLGGPLLTDFLSTINDRRQCATLRDEINLLYVSVTRAKRFLTVNSVMLQVLRLCREKREVLVAGSEVGEGRQCVYCAGAVDGKQPVVTKMMDLCVTGSGFLQGGYLCHTCSSNPRRYTSASSTTLVKVLHPHDNMDISSSARLMLLSGQP
ncbi:F-box DNA helicase 1-like isoform X2 [Portunus trituberculatus]|uniref:F-box DNA helicase 1-like isoform X2 n=1 Tax=Portunus trituberculatus TaxID=210409 RepID=UPI001E1D1070|nr:F-box DNA helicase 1-like isoform X2 [Portunus trituberculatus]